MIRRATPDDAETVARINRESRAEAMPWLPDLHTPEEDVAWFRGLLAGEAWIFEEDGEPVGYAGMKDGELHDLYVAPDAQRRGVGGALFAQVQAAYPDGFRFWAFRDNTGGFELSLRLGFGSAPAGGRDLLGWWIVPIGLVVGCGLVMLTTRFALWCARQYRRSRVLPPG